MSTKKPIPPPWSLADIPAPLASTIYVQARRWITVRCTEGDFAGFACEVAALSEDERAPLRPDQTYDELTTKLAPLVKSWNACRRDPGAGTVLPLPAPGDAGPRAFDAVDLGLVQYIRRMAISAAYVEPPGPMAWDETPVMPPIGQVG